MIGDGADVGADNELLRGARVWCGARIDGGRDPLLLRPVEAGRQPRPGGPTSRRPCGGFRARAVSARPARVARRPTEDLSGGPPYASPSARRAAAVRRRRPRARLTRYLRGPPRPRRRRRRCDAHRAPLDVRRTLMPLRRGGGDPAFRITPDGTVWRASRTPERARHPAADRQPGRDRGLGLGAGRALAARRAARPARRRRRPRPPSCPGTVSCTPRTGGTPGCGCTRTGLVLESLIPSVLEQKVTTDRGVPCLAAAAAAARRAGARARRRRRAARHARHARRARAGPGCPSWDWRGAGVDGKRAVGRPARGTGRRARSTRSPPLGATRRRALLQTIPGIGPWTAAETLQRSHGAPDAVTVGDLHLPHHSATRSTGEPRPTTRGCWSSSPPTKASGIAPPG